MIAIQVPSSLNRVYSLVHPDRTNVTISYLAGLVLSLMGFWNSVIYIFTSRAACKELFFSITMFCFPRRRGRNFASSSYRGASNSSSSSRYRDGTFGRISHISRSGKGSESPGKGTMMMKKHGRTSITITTTPANDDITSDAIPLSPPLPSPSALNSGIHLSPSPSPSPTPPSLSLSAMDVKSHDLPTSYHHHDYPSRPKPKSRVSWSDQWEMLHPQNHLQAHQQSHTDPRHLYYPDDTETFHQHNSTIMHDEEMRRGEHTEEEESTDYQESDSQRRSENISGMSIV